MPSYTDLPTELQSKIARQCNRSLQLKFMTTGKLECFPTFGINVFITKERWTYPQIAGDRLQMKSERVCCVADKAEGYGVHWFED